MSEPARRRATCEDPFNLAENVTGEFIDGEQNDIPRLSNRDIPMRQLPWGEKISRVLFGSISRLSSGTYGRPFRHSGGASGPESSFLRLLSGSKILDSGQKPAGMTSIESLITMNRTNRVCSLVFSSVLLVSVLSNYGNLLSETRPSVAAELSSINQKSSVPAGEEPNTPSLRTPGPSATLNSLTEEERAWLRQHPVIQLVQDPGWPPIEFADEKGENLGITSDYLKLIEQRLGLKFEQVRNLSWQEAYARLKRWEIDMTPSVAVTPERTEFWAFTKPYMKIPIVILTGADVTYITSMRNLEGRKVAIVDGYAVSEWIPRDFPGIQLIKVNTAKEGIELLQNKEVFAFIDNMLVIGYYLAKLKVINVKIAGETPYVNAQSMAVRKDWAILAGILQKSLDSISETERDEIYQKWIPIRYEHGFNYNLLWQALAIFTVILLALIFWNRRLSREIRCRKEAQTALSESEMRTRYILNNVGAYVFIKDTHYRYTYVNNKVCDLFGHKEQDILGKGDDEFFSTTSVEELMRSDRPVIEKGETVEREEKNLAAPDQRPRTYWAVKIPLRDTRGKIYGLCGIATDITDRKLAEVKVQDHAHFLETLFDTIPSPVFHKDAFGHYTGCNRAFLEFIGKPMGEVLGKTVYDLAPREIADKYAEQDRELFEHPGRQHYEWQVLNGGGELRNVIFDKAILRDAHGVVIGLIGVISDITERKQAEDERRKLEERLLRAEKMEALGILAGGVAHDLNNVLGILVGYSELMYDEIDETSPFRDHVRNIMIGGERAAAIVQDLLTLARRGVQTKTVINLNKTVGEYLRSPEFVKLASYHPNVRVRTETEEGLMTILGSPVHLAKTLMNLVVNAAEAMPSGGEVVISTESVYLERPVSGYDHVESGDYAVLSVSDNGEGISDDDMRRIFEPFYTKKVMGRSGTGLGLAVVWGTVKDHKGYIDVQSKRGKGTTFTLYFPVTREEMEKDTTPPSEEYMGRGERILVVDDVKEQRELATQMLTKLGYRVAAVSSGEEAVTYLEAHQVDLVVLDMIMDPGIDGFETYRQILEIRPGQKAVIVSGFAETERVKMAQGLGAGAYVKKPYVSERIGMAIRRELDK
jgi:two-component system, cell cycle sensor histidine kinase and response regulator CckA